MQANPYLYVGTYTEPIVFGTGQVLQGRGEGIHRFRFDAASGALEPCGVTRGVRNPSFLTFGPGGRHLYAVNELKSFEGKVGGAVSAFDIDAATGELQLLNMRATHGTDPCHLALDRTGRFLVVVNFAGGSLCVLPVLPDGSLAEAQQVIAHRGSSIDPARQAGPHPHAIEFDASNRFVLVPDLGLDRTMVYRFDAATGQLSAGDIPWIESTPGAGPRQTAIHPGGRFAYVVNELASSVTAYAYDAARGDMRALQTLPTLPAGFGGHSSCAEMQISRSGRHLYASNRGHDSIAAYAIDPETGRLSPRGHTSTQGRIPRHFEIDPGGGFLVAANQDTDALSVFRLDEDSGALAAVGPTVSVPSPVCVRFHA